MKRKMKKDMRMKVINLYGGPGTGKSTSTAGVFNIMKKKGIKVELITEYAKDVVYQESFFKLKDQLYIFTKQHHNVWKIRNKVDYAVVDSPLLLSLHYFQENDIYDEDLFKSFVFDVFNKYDNINIFLERDHTVHPYQEYGRTQSKEEAEDIDTNLLKILDEYNIPYVKMKIHDDIEKEIVDYVLSIS
jgi:hypothetical protein